VRGLDSLVLPCKLQVKSRVHSRSRGCFEDCDLPNSAIKIIMSNGVQQNVSSHTRQQLSLVPENQVSLPRKIVLAQCFVGADSKVSHSFFRNGLASREHQQTCGLSLEDACCSKQSTDTHILRFECRLMREFKSTKTLLVLTPRSFKRMLCRRWAQTFL